jgi:hypothetical protein
MNTIKSKDFTIWDNVGKIVDDPKLTSAKNRKKQGLDPLNEKENNQHTAKDSQENGRTAGSRGCWLGKFAPN